MDVMLAPIRPHEHPETAHTDTDPPPPPNRSLRSRALEVRDLVRVGELSRGVARADAAQLARPSASTIACLTKLIRTRQHNRLRHPTLGLTSCPLR